jgi:hypothetical protein
MGFLDRLLGRETPQQQPYQQQGYGQQDYGQQQGYASGPQDSTTGATAQDRAAIARYRYLLRTAPPEQIEEAHAQAFSQLTPPQRQQVLQEMTQTLPASERPPSDDPRQMARAATRAEMQQPGYLQRTFGGRGYAGGMGGGGMMGALGGSLLGTIAGVVIGTAVADAMLGGFEGSPEQQDFAAGGDGSGEASGGDTGGDASGGDAGSGDAGGADAGGYDTGGGYDTAGDSGFGGGDFGGGDFGGGDFGGF